MVLPYHTKKFGQGFLVICEKGREKILEKQTVLKQNLELYVKILGSFAVALPVSADEVVKCINENINVIEFLPKEILQYATSLVK
jgi:hypothetical protein